jgi:hypothetical protein
VILPWRRWKKPVSRRWSTVDCGCRLTGKLTIRQRLLFPAYHCETVIRRSGRP